MLQRECGYAKTSMEPLILSASVAVFPNRDTKLASQLLTELFYNLMLNEIAGMDNKAIE